ncbi:efflux RND transporter periplasmic adaptor subunit [Oleiagrimonas soli]|uniref:RND family efflux transporter MFP subunit n=1 Tax=Oleiagrimonas soli TaxID=1543381 RepID=A0A099CZP0_9GAMM|nr:efflux RND transporter periplasmic adaptor subunit [Oleiagrimonas soli]KGI78475.1 RND transporter [Oleiagrimonas soli]MBB6184275.1 RND family efflux transporter MFP subunit [Oleiagrimonas soli]
MIRSTRLALAALLLTALAGCGDKTSPQTAQQRAPSLPTVTVKSETAHREQVWDGVVEAVNEVTLTAQTNARVLELPHDVGDTVAKGDVLVRFTDVEQQSARRAAQAQIASARASLRNADAHYKRIAEIFSKGLIAQADLDQARMQRDAAQAALNAAQAQYSEAGQKVDYTVIRAPYAGIVTRRYVHVGEAVQAGPPSPQPLIGLESLNDLRVTVQVPQSAVEAIRRHQHAELLLGDGQRLAASKVIVFPYADPKTHTFNVRLELDGSHATLYPGMTVKVAFAVGDTKRLLVPMDALWHQGEMTGVYVLEGQDVRLLQVRVGERFGTRVEVVSGLTPNQRVVTDPAAAARYLSGERTEPKT